MLPSIRKILLACDLSDNSAHALEYAVSVAEQYKSEIMVLHVLESVSSNPYLQLKGFKSKDEWQSLEQRREKDLMQELVNRLQQLCDQMNGQSSVCQIRGPNILLRKGVPVEVILNVAREKMVDLIVIGTHGYGIVKDALMGGTARRVLRRSSIPVLVVQPADA